MRELEELKLTVKPIADCEHWEIRNQLSDFVKDNWELLWVGANRSRAIFDCYEDMKVCVYERDYWAGQRIQLNQTRLCEHKGLKYAEGHKYSSDAIPCEYQLREVVNILQYLINCASRKGKPISFKLIIEETK